MPYKNTFHGLRSTLGFTLVELLVVISIIALLISILLPSLKKARQSAKKVACAANIRSIAQGSLTYAADDPNENAIAVNVGANNFVRTTLTYYGYGGKAGLGSGEITTSPFGPSNDMDPLKRPLNAVFYKSIPKAARNPGRGNWIPLTKLNFGVYHCPGDKGFTGFHHVGWKESKLSSYDYYGTSYACNPLWVWDPEDPANLQSNSMYLRPMSRVPNPTNTIMYWENAARYSITSNWDDDGKRTQPPASCRTTYPASFVARGFHDQPWNFNVSFGDGHAENMFIRSYVVATGNQQPAVCRPNRCICVLIRGSGWQLDTMPGGLIKHSHVPTTDRRVQSGESDPVFAVVP